MMAFLTGERRNLSVVLICISFMARDGAHQTLKVQLQRKGEPDSSPATQINKALFTLNFKNWSESGFTPSEKHWDNHNKHLPQVLWKHVMTRA
jgi:hypothetical protein